MDPTGQHPQNTTPEHYKRTVKRPDEERAERLGVLVVGKVARFPLHEDAAPPALEQPGAGLGGGRGGAVVLRWCFVLCGWFGSACGGVGVVRIAAPQTSHGSIHPPLTSAAAAPAAGGRSGGSSAGWPSRRRPPLRARGGGTGPGATGCVCVIFVVVLCVSVVVCGLGLRGGGGWYTRRASACIKIL